MTTNGARTLQDVLGLVRKYVAEEVSARSFGLVVSETNAEQEEDWWYIVVQPDRSGVRSYEYSDSLTRVEDRIREREHVNVLLIPTLA